MTSLHTLSTVGARLRVRLMVAALSALALTAALGLASPALAFTDTKDESGDMVVFGGQHQVVKEGQEVTGDLVVIGGSADVLGKVDGDAVALGGKIYIAPQGRVNGSRVEVGGTIDDESSGPHRPVAPVQPTAAPTAEPQNSDNGQDQAPGYGGWSAFFLIDTLLVFLAFLLFPARTASAASHLRDNPLLAGILGFFWPIIFVLVVIALAITLVGIPLIPLAVLATIGGYLIGKAAIAEFIGSRIQDLAKAARPTAVASVGIGLALLLLITALGGWIGIVIFFCIGALAIGTALYMLMRTAEAYRGRKTITTPPAAGSFPVPSAPATPPPADPSATHPQQ